MDKRKGFTLIELIVVITLVAILSGIATVRFVGSFQGRSLVHFTNELVNFLRYIQFKTIEEGSVHKLEVDSEEGRLTSSAQAEESVLFEEISTPFSSRFGNKLPFTIELEKG